MSNTKRTQTITLGQRMMGRIDAIELERRGVAIAPDTNIYVVEEARNTVEPAIGEVLTKDEVTKLIERDGVEVRIRPARG